MLALDSFRVVHQALVEDARRVAEWGSAAIVSLRDEFREHDPDELWSNVDLEIRVERGGKPGTVPLTTRQIGIGLSATIRLLAPSLHPEDARTMVGAPIDEHYFRRVLSSEVATVFLERMSRLKPGGWRLHGAPSWFVQGLQEHLGIVHGGEHERTVTAARYLKTVHEDPERISASPSGGIAVKSVYLDGAVLVRWMHERFGREKVHALLLSSEPTFAKAVVSVLGMPETALLAPFRKWLAAKWLEQGRK